MHSNDFTELQILVAKLKIASNKAATSDKTFKRYQQSSIDFLEKMPQHLNALQQGLSIAKPLQEDEVNQIKEVYMEQMA